ncbi:MAG: hypothetical protein JJT76_14310 [Clostridiaceae bacterium]|nr:hypothetical protein [Clostridiaceae bacterium]
MTLEEVRHLLDAEVLSGHEYMKKEVSKAFSCDLMSDALTSVEDRTLLLTGLVNPHTVRTAEMLDISGVVFVRGKVPDEDTIKLAKENGIVIMITKYTLYVSSGILYSNGLEGASILHN